MRTVFRPYPIAAYFASVLWTAAAAAAPAVPAGDLSPGTRALYESRGKAAWLRNCIVCHGVDGKGNTEWASQVSPPPKDLTNPLNVTWAFREDWLRLRIAGGVPGTAMPGWQGVLSEPDLTAVTLYVQALCGADRMTEADARKTRLARGEKIYRERCAVCHGVNGNADTKIAKAVEPPPRSLVDADAQRTLYLDRIRRVVREGKPGTVMPAWEGVLDRQDMDAVAVYVREALQKHSRAGRRRPQPAGTVSRGCPCR